MSSREKWYTKVRIIVSNCGNIIFAPEPHFVYIYRKTEQLSYSAHDINL
jgi:hypothetical protein